MSATRKPAPPSEPKEATRTEWVAWGAAVVAALLLLAGTLTLWQSDEAVPTLTAITLGQGLVLLFLGVAATVVSAASFVVVALARRWPLGGS
jgi:hypothetical protein